MKLWMGIGTLLLMLACTPGQNASEEEHLEDTTSGTDMTAVDTTPAPDTAEDTNPGHTATGLDLLYCELDNTLLLQSALRAGACLEGAAVAGVLDDAARGFVYGEIMTSGYSALTYGNCDFLACLANANSCTEAQACDDARVKELCSDTPYATRCSGNHLEICRWQSEEIYRWVRVQDCTRIEGGECQQEDVERAYCVGPVSIDSCPGYYGGCDGDDLIRCVGDRPDTNTVSEIRIDCSELVEGGTCIETAVGGEAPGPTCSLSEPECTNAFAEGFACDEATGTIEVCLYGQIVSVSCTDSGYSGCETGSFFGVRCVP